MKLASCKSALTPLVVYSTDRSKAVVLVLLFVALWFIPRGDVFYVLPCVILFLCFSVLLALRLSRLGKNLSAYRTFVRFALVWFCLFPLPLQLGVWEGLRFVIVALPGLGVPSLTFFLFFNTHCKLSSTIDRIVINKRSLVSRNPFICFGTTKFLYWGIDIMKSSHNNNIISSFISWSQNILPLKFLDTMFQISKR